MVSLWICYEMGASSRHLVISVKWYWCQILCRSSGTRSRIIFLDSHGFLIYLRLVVTLFSHCAYFNLAHKIFITHSLHRTGDQSLCKLMFVVGTQEKRLAWIIVSLLCCVCVLPLIQLMLDAVLLICNNVNIVWSSDNVYALHMVRFFDSFLKQAHE